MTAVYGILGVAFLLVIRVLFNQYNVDRLRDELFRLREELFLMALSPDLNISFRTQTYKDTNQMLNNMIRFSHRVSFAYSMVFRILNTMTFPRGTKVQDTLFLNVSNGINRMRKGPAKDEMQSLFDRYNRLITGYLWRTSLLFDLYAGLKVTFAFSGEVLQRQRELIEKNAARYQLEQKTGSNFTLQAQVA